MVGSFLEFHGQFVFNGFISHRRMKKMTMKWRGWLAGLLANSTPDILDHGKLGVKEVGWLTVSGGNSTVNPFFKIKIE